MPNVLAKTQNEDLLLHRWFCESVAYWNYRLQCRFQRGWTGGGGCQVILTNFVIKNNQISRLRTGNRFLLKINDTGDKMTQV